ncbi:MAG: hypothetical protein IT457_22000 [Planctomycetes bacterium]|nr:hypothetical protein [Planctomycetota bacterium]
MPRSRSVTPLAVVCLTATAWAQALMPPPAPFENRTTAAKALLGKALFWDEQLSSDNTMACGSCHRPGAGGADPRLGRHPGPDALFHSADDRLGSPGVVRSDAAGTYSPSPLFGLTPQVTARVTPTNLGAAWQSALRWDGRATETFVDPVTRTLRIMFGGALENHAAGPPVDPAEMAYAARGWADIAQKLGRVRPLALATNLPADLAQALAGGGVDYGELMRRAYGDRGIDATRILYALAAYQRTLVPDQTPWDRYVLGNAAALSQDQRAGLALFEGAAHCAQCHTTPLFSDGSFRNLGLRPVGEDLGWQLATTDPTDRGKFKVPTLRLAGLRNRFMHNGQFATLAQVVEFYDRGGGAFPDNKDPALVPLGLNAVQKAQLVEFLAHALTDPRAAAETAPFDRPTLWSERAPAAFGAALAGSGGIAPRTLHEAPAALGNAEFRIGIADALGAAPAVLLFAAAAGAPGQQLGALPIHVALVPPPILVPIALLGHGAGAGHATLGLPIPDLAALRGASLVHQAVVLDPAAPGGIAGSAGYGHLLF